ncbi:MAG: thermonuclease family protein [Cycloclasticus sp.]
MMLIDLIKKKVKLSVARVDSSKNLLFWLFLTMALASSSSVIARETGRVAKVVDGDTVVLTSGEKVRLLSINAPEIGYRGELSEPGGYLAKEQLQGLVLGQLVYIEPDVELVDHYGRTLAHLFLANGRHINREMVRDGLAISNIHPPNLKYAEDLQVAQRYAEKKRSGLWQLRAYQVKPVTAISTMLVKKWGRFDGQIKTIQRSKKGTKLYFDKTVYIWLARRDLKYFQNLNRYKGREIEVRGWPGKRGGQWSIRVRHPSQIILKP